jgi:hypothetical protein
MLNMNIEKRNWNILFGLWALQGMVALCCLLLMHKDVANVALVGYSLGRLVLIGVAFTLTVMSIFFWFYSQSSLVSGEWTYINSRSGFWDFLYVAALFILFISSFMVLYMQAYQASKQFISYAERLSPILMWFGFSSVELIVIILLKRYEKSLEIYNHFKPVWKKTGFVFVFLLFVAGVVGFTGIGITPDKNMGAPAIPLFEWQIVLVFLILGILAFLPKSWFRLIDKWAVLGVYVFTLVLWLSQPVNPAYTATPPRAPNYEIYPFSDPQIYSQYAQSALIGNGFLWPEVPSRPFYISLLTWLHFFGKQDYNRVVILQSFILAAFPVILYLIGKELGGRSLGLALAVFAALRDVNSNIMVSFASNVTYSKLLLSEIPLAVFLSLFILVSIRWLLRKSASIWVPLLAGGILGAATLIRTQSLSFLMVIVPLSLWIIPNRRQRFTGLFALLVGLSLTLLPWLLRNYIATGGIILDNPVSQVMTMARRWSGSWGNEMIPKLDGENYAQYSSRLTWIMVEALKQNPVFILKTAANHFVNSEIVSLMVFPVRDEIRSPNELIWPQHAFWETPLRASQFPIFFIYVLLFGIGIAFAYHHHGWIGLLPLSLGIVYNAWTALFFSSGERFVVPVDWSIYLYQSLGLITLGALALSFSQGARESALSWVQRPFDDHPIRQENQLLSRRYLVFSLVTVLCLGLFSPVTEFVFPKKYPPITQEKVVQKIGLPAKNGEAAVYGRAIYPRYYSSGEGEPDTEKLGYGRSGKSRLVFFLVGPSNGLVIFELQDVPKFFPHASDVFMIGSWVDGYFSPRIAMVSKDGRSEVYQIK